MWLLAGEHSAVNKVGIWLDSTSWIRPNMGRVTPALCRLSAGRLRSCKPQRANTRGGGGSAWPPQVSGSKAARSTRSPHLLLPSANTIKMRKPPKLRDLWRTAGPARANPGCRCGHMWSALWSRWGELLQLLFFNSWILWKIIFRRSFLRSVRFVVSNFTC